MRDPKKDLEVCNRATPGPWIICLGSGDHVATGIMQGVNDGAEDDGGFGTMVCDCLPDYFLRPVVKTPKDHRHNMRLIAMAREALPYWIERAKQAEKDHAALREVLEIMRSIAAAEDDEKMRTLRGLARQTVSMYDRGKLGLKCKMNGG